MTNGNSTYQTPVVSDVIGRIRRWAAEQPDRVAVRYSGQRLTYQRLVNAIDQVANSIHSELGDSKGNIGIYVERNEFLPAFLLGCWQAGKTYVPLDPALPIGRIQMMVARANCTGIICSKELSEKIEGLKMPVLHAEEIIQGTGAAIKHRVASPHDLSHIIFTSGSTGRPKGVMISHGNLQSFLSWSVHEFTDVPFETLLAGTSIAFDLSVFELFLPLILGREVRILRSNLDLTDALEQEQKVMVNTVPSVIGELLQAGVDFSPVVALNMAGEPIPETTIRQLRQWPEIALRNLYGPSECTTYITQHLFNASNTVSIGKVLGDNRLYLLDAERNPVAKGEVGEICISGSSVSPGYVNDPEATEASFVADPFVDGARMYVTGDFASENEDGNLLFKGRRDDQVKLRGYRIELEEIARSMEQVQGVAQALAVIRSSPKEAGRLVGYYVANQDIHANDWKASLGQTLPNYMIPDAFLRLSRFPLNANGKIDKLQLPSPLPPAASGVDRETVFSGKKEQLASIWKSVIGVSAVNDDDHFFELGGHSLMALRLSGRIAKEMDVRIHSADIFRHPLFAELSAFIQAVDTSGYEPIPRLKNTDAVPLTPAQNQAWLVSKDPVAAASQNIGFALMLKGVLNVEALKDSVFLLLERHAALRLQFASRHGQPIQQVVKHVDGFFERAEIASVTSPEDHVRTLLQEEINQPMLLSKAPLMRCKLLKYSNESHGFMIVLHHIVCDGWSVEVLLNEWIKVYDALQKGEEPRLPAQVSSFADYVDWLNHRLESMDGEAMRKHWTNRLNTLRIPAPAVFGELRASSPARNGQQVDVAMTDEQSDRFTAMAHRLNTGRFGMVAACLALLIHRYSGLDQVALGMPVSGRSHPDLEHVVGMFMNMIPLVLDIDAQWTFERLLQHVNERIQQDLKHQEYPLSFLSNNLQSRNQPLFSTGMTWQNYGSNLMSQQVGGLEITPIVPQQLFIDRPIWFFGTEFSDRFSLSILYDSAAFETGSVVAIGEHFTQLLLQAAENPQAKLSQFKLLAQDKGQVDNTIDFQFDF